MTGKRKQPPQKANVKEKARKKEIAKEEATAPKPAKVEKAPPKVAEKRVFPLAPLCDVIVMGSGEIGQLGMGKEVLEKKKPTLVPDMKNKHVLKLAVGGLHVAVLVQHEDDKDNTTLHTWGCNDQFVLGRDTPTSGDENADDPSMSPGIVPALEGKHIIDVTTGEYHAAALDDEGRVYVWGTYKDAEGFLGFTKQQRQIQDRPILLPGLKGKRVKQIASGYNHTLALTEHGELYVWGFSWIGRRVSDRLRKEHLTPARVDFPPHANPPKIKSVHAGGFHSFAITEDGKVFSWGLNNAGQLGHNDTVARGVPTEIRTLRDQNIVSITGGQHHSLALSAEGKVWVFGRGDYGQLGNGAKNSVLTPQELNDFSDGEKVVKVACGDSHSMAITEEGSLYVWGFNEMHQLGIPKEDDDDSDVLEPHKVPFNSYDIIDAGGGGQHSTLLGTKREQ